MAGEIAARFSAYGKTAAAWTSLNPVPLAREFCVETDTNRIKIGNGTTAWNSLPYYDGSNAETIRDVIGAALLAGAGLAMTVNDPADTITVGLAAGRALPLTGTGTPEGAVTAGRGTMFLRTDGGAGTTLYIKESGTGNTGWVAK